MERPIVIASLLLVCTLNAAAQTEDEYLMEVGAGVGMLSYQGDFNGSILKNQQAAGSVVLRRNFNPYMGLRLMGTMSKLSGSSDDVETYLPDYQTERYDFSRTLVDVSLTYEYNFWPYGTGREYRGAKPVTPFIFLGLGATYATGEGESTFTANIPIGLGVKCKLTPRLNLGIEWAAHFSLSDELDGARDPYGIKSSGICKNTDGYTALQLTLTYSFMAKCRTCHNADE